MWEQHLLSVITGKLTQDSAVTLGVLHGQVPRLEERCERWFWIPGVDDEDIV